MIWSMFLGPKLETSVGSLVSLFERYQKSVQGVYELKFCWNMFGFFNLEQCLNLISPCNRLINL